jgi:hypothetical protein
MIYRGKSRGTTMTTYTAREQAAALLLLRQGHLTIAEAAGLMGISRQLMRYGAGRAGFDPILCRQTYLLKLWRKTLERARP